MLKLKYKGKVNNLGKLELFHMNKMNNDLKNFINKEVTLIVEGRKKSASNKQVGYWYGVIIPHVYEGFREIGYNYTKKHVEELINTAFLFEDVINEETGEINRVFLSLRKGEIDRKIYSDAVDGIKIFAAEWLQKYVPDSDER